MEPEDPTSVVLMMEDFKTFSKAGRSRRQPNRSEHLAMSLYFFSPGRKLNREVLALMQIRTSLSTEGCSHLIQARNWRKCPGGQNLSVQSLWWGGQKPYVVIVGGFGGRGSGATSPIVSYGMMPLGIFKKWNRLIDIVLEV